MQLESAGQDPAAFREGVAAKEQVAKLGKEIEEMYGFLILFLYLN